MALAIVFDICKDNTFLLDSSWLQYNHRVFFPYREKELAAVKINAAEVDIIASELEVRFYSNFHAFLLL